MLKNKDSRANYPEPMRRVRALVEVDGKERETEFLTNNLQWNATSVADLCRCRWQIEVFFKQIKQSLQLCDFPRNSANTVRWQVWTALLPYVLTRFHCVLDPAQVVLAPCLAIGFPADLKSHNVSGRQTRGFLTKIAAKASVNSPVEIPLRYSAGTNASTLGPPHKPGRIALENRPPSRCRTRG